MLAQSSIRTGRVRGRYYRENFAQGGVDLVQVLPELVTNADAAITASGRQRGRIELAFGRPDSELQARWRRELRALGVPLLANWRWQVQCTDDGEGLDVAAVDERLGALGVEPPRRGQRGLFGRGLRDVWLAQGAGRLESVRDGRIVESWFFPSPSDDAPYAYVHVRDEPVRPADLAALGLRGSESGTRVSVPLSTSRLPAAGRLRTLARQLVQLRSVLEDPSREVVLSLPGESSERLAAPTPEPDPERPVLFDDEVEVRAGVAARIVVRLAAKPFTLGPSRATRPGGLVVRSGRAAHEATLAGHEGRPGARRLYGEVWCEALDEMQRRALDSPRPEVVVRVDRGGLNEHHPLTRALYRAIDRVLGPIVAAEEHRANAHLIKPGRAIAARDREGLRALNDALRSAFDRPGSAGFTSGGSPAERSPLDRSEADATERRNGQEPATEAPAPPEPGPPGTPIRFKHSPIRLHPTEQRGTSLIIDPERIGPGTPITLAADAGLWVRAQRLEVPDPGARPWVRVAVDLRARASVEPGSRLRVIAEAGGHEAELEAIVVRHRSSGWVREIARKDEDAPIEAEFDPETGTVTVYEGRPEFKALERAARRGGIPKRRVREYLPHRMLEVEVAANAVYLWAAERIVARRAELERSLPAPEHARAVRLEAQRLRHRFHERLMRAFLDPEVFEGRVRVESERASASRAQARLPG